MADTSRERLDALVSKEDLESFVAGLIEANQLIDRVNPDIIEQLCRPRQAYE
ncbi:TPA: hypothetical protein HA231_01620 [Candidatus Woesearchaeota archaeon]|nr:hypothetical protein [Candidatus Woesearchaeota archaeon]